MKYLILQFGLKFRRPGVRLPMLATKMKQNPQEKKSKNLKKKEKN